MLGRRICFLGQVLCVYLKFHLKVNISELESLSEMLSMRSLGVILVSYPFSGLAFRFANCF